MVPPGRDGARMSRIRGVGFEDRFWDRVNTDGPAATVRPELGVCWLWTGPPTASGYGQVWRDGKAAHAHVVAWELAAGRQAPAGLRFRHHACQVRLCVNPGHLMPYVARDTPQGARFLAEWNLTHTRCVAGHEFTTANTILVPGGRACRRCRADIDRRRRQVSR